MKRVFLLILILTIAAGPGWSAGDAESEKQKESLTLRHYMSDRDGLQAIAG